MRSKRLLIILAFIVLLPLSLYSQAHHRFTHKLLVGFNLGAATPRSMPAEVRSIDGFWPTFNPQLGYNIVYKYNRSWGVSAGALLDMKGFGIRNKVKYMHTNVLLNDEGQTLNGYFTGRNETTLHVAYLTIPVYIVFEPNTLWQFKGGAYFSYNYNADFKGLVWDGYLRLNNFEDKVIIKDKGEATFNFGEDVNSIDVGITLGAERKINDRFGIYGNLSLGLKPIFPSGFQALDYKMYNAFFSVGMTYSLK